MFHGWYVVVGLESCDYYFRSGVIDVLSFQYEEAASFLLKRFFNSLIALFSARDGERSSAAAALYFCCVGTRCRNRVRTLPLGQLGFSA